MEENNVEVQTANTTPNNSTNEKKGFNITSLILGIIAIITSFFYLYATIPAGIIGIIFGIAGRKEASKDLGTFGMVFSIVALGICVVMAFI